MVRSLKLRSLYFSHCAICAIIVIIYDSYGDGTHMLFKWGIIQISTESIVRGLHLSLRTITVSMFGILLALTSEIVMIFIA